MEPLTIDALFDAAIHIQLVQEKSLTMTFSGSVIRIKFPTTRRLADFLAVPHYYMLPYFGMMEKEDLITRMERVGIMTTAKGSRKFIQRMMERYSPEAEQVLGPVVCTELSLQVRHEEE